MFSDIEIVIKIVILSIEQQARNFYKPLYRTDSLLLPRGRKGLTMENVRNDRKERKVTAQMIGAGIRRLRTEHRETQEQLGDYIGYGATTIANYESGYRLPDLETFFEIVIHYEAELGDFIRF